MWTVDYNNRGRGWRSKEFVSSAPRKRDNAFTRLSVSSFRGVAFRERDEFVLRGPLTIGPNFFVSKAGTSAIEVRVRNLPEDSIAAQYGCVVYGFDGRVRLWQPSKFGGQAAFAAA